MSVGIPSLIHVVITLEPSYMRETHITSPQLSEVLTSCQKLKYLRYIQYYHYYGNKQFLSPAHSCNLEQIYIMSKDTDLSDTFFNTISAHGGLVHVVLYVSSVTKKGVSVLVRNSPKLMGFHASLYDDDIKVDRIYKFVVKQFSHRQLITKGNFTMEWDRRIRCGKYIPLADAEDEHQSITNLSSLWHSHTDIL